MGIFSDDELVRQEAARKRKHNASMAIARDVVKILVEPLVSYARQCHENNGYVSSTSHTVGPFPGTNNRISAMVDEDLRQVLKRRVVTRFEVPASQVSVEIHRSDVCEYDPGAGVTLSATVVFDPPLKYRSRSYRSRQGKSS